MNEANSLLGINDLVLKKKILSLHEHYDLDGINETKLGSVDSLFGSCSYKLSFGWFW